MRHCGAAEGAGQEWAGVREEGLRKAHNQDGLTRLIPERLTCKSCGEELILCIGGPSHKVHANR